MALATLLIVSQPPKSVVAAKTAARLSAAGAVRFRPPWRTAFCRSNLILNSTAQLPNLRIANARRGVHYGII
jgi:hypothetical protein